MSRTCGYRCCGKHASVTGKWTLCSTQVFTGRRRGLVAGHSTSQVRAVLQSARMCIMRLASSVYAYEYILYVFVCVCVCVAVNVCSKYVVF